MSTFLGLTPNAWKFGVEILSGLASAFGVTVALIRPWYLQRTSRHRLRVSLVNSVGDRTAMEAPTIKGELPVYYYYIQVDNRRPTLPANNVRVVITGLAEEEASGRFVEKLLMIPVPLTWSFPRERPPRITISKTDICDLGLVIAQDGVTPNFQLTTYPNQTPRNFRNHIVPNETARLRIEAHADDCFSNPVCIEIANTGTFAVDGVAVKQVTSLTR